MNKVREFLDSPAPLWAWKILFAAAVLGPLVLTISGCQSTTSALSQIDYGCVDIELDAPYTESSVLGRGIILPEGKELDRETIDSLCNY